MGKDLKHIFILCELCRLGRFRHLVGNNGDRVYQQMVVSTVAVALPLPLCVAIPLMNGGADCVRLGQKVVVPFRGRYRWPTLVNST